MVYWNVFLETIVWPGKEAIGLLPKISRWLLPVTCLYIYAQQYRNVSVPSVNLALGTLIFLYSRAHLPLVREVYFTLYRVSHVPFSSRSTTTQEVISAACLAVIYRTQTLPWWSTMPAWRVRCYMDIAEIVSVLLPVCLSVCSSACVFVCLFVCLSLLVDSCCTGDLLVVTTM